MKWRFWKREKKEEALLDLKFDKNVRKNTSFKSGGLLGVDFAQKEPTIILYDDIITEPIATTDDIQENCLGTKTDGTDCSRIVNTLYCWQHKK